MGFIEAYKVAREDDELVREYNRLTGHNIPLLTGDTRPTIRKMVDSATGVHLKGEEEFVSFFSECIWNTLPRNLGTTLNNIQEETEHE